MSQLIKKILCFAPIPVLIVCVNLWQDPAHNFRDGSYEKGLAQLLLNGQNATGVSNYDDRLMQMHYVRGLKKAPDVLVLGSSRSMSLDAGLFPGSSFYNDSVSGASVEDFTGIYQLYRSRALLPKRVIIGLDPWILNRNNEQNRWVRLSDHHWAFARQMHLPGSFKTYTDVAKYHYQYLAELLSPGYFLKSINAIRERQAQQYQPTALPDDPVLAVKRSDGSLSYDAQTRSRSQAAVDRLATKTALSSAAYSLGNFSEIDPGLQAEFEALLRLLRQDGVTVVLWLPPYHPKAYSRIIAAGRSMLPRVEDYFRSYAAQAGIPIIGSYDPGRLKLDGTFFFDGMHLKPEGVAKIFNLDRHHEQSGT